MSKKIVYQGQSFLDKVLETTGSIENAFEMGLLNGISVTDDVIVGSELKIGTITKGVIADFFNALNRPATGISAADLQGMNPVLGIGTMRIGSTFIVSP
jgi:hypothetical protein